MKVAYYTVKGENFISAPDLLANMLESKVQLLEQVTNERDRKMATAALDVYINWLKEHNRV